MSDTRGSNNQILFNRATENLTLEGDIAKACLQMGQFFTILSHTKSLIFLELSYVILCDFEVNQIMKNLMTALKANRSLKSLILKGNNLKGPFLQDFSDYIRHTTGLEFLDVSSNYFGNEGISIIAEALGENKSIKVFKSNGNKIEDLAAKDIANLLIKNKIIILLYFCENLIGPLGSRILARALKANTTLQEFHLYHNQIGAEGSKELAAPLIENTTLRVIDVTKNNIGDDGAAEFSKALLVNRTLKSLNIAWNQINRMGGTHLFNSLEYNYTLGSLCTYWNKMGKLESRIDRRLRRNRNVKMAAEAFCCIVRYQQLVELHSNEGKSPIPSPFFIRLSTQTPEIAKFFDISSRLPVEIQLTIAGFFAGTCVLAPGIIIGECSPPYGRVDEVPLFHWSSGAKHRFHDETGL